MRNQLRSGVYLSYLNLAISCIIPFFYTPIMLKMLGQSEYGLYSLANSVVGYLSLLSFGFGSTIVRYLSKYRAENDRDGFENTYGFFLILYGILAVAVIIGGIFISFNVSSIFSQGLDTDEVQKMKILVLIMAFNTAISFPFSVFSSVVITYERYFFRKMLDVILTVATPIGNLIILYLGYNSVGMALIGTLIQVIYFFVLAVYCYRILCVKPHFQKMNRGLLREMIGFSFFVFVGSIVDMLFWATDKVILGMLASSAAVAIYNVGCTFNNMVMSLSTSISGVLVPKITEMVVTNTNKTEWTELFIKVGRIQFLIIALIVSGFSVFGQSFVRLWAGTEYLDAFWVAVLTMFPLTIPLIQNTGISIITAQNKHRFRSLIYLAIAILNVVATYLIVPYRGIIGAAMCSCVSYVLGQGLIMNIYYYKVVGLDIPMFWKNILHMAVIPSAMIAAGILMKRFVLIDNWISFLLCVIIYTIIYVVLMYCFAMNDYEKDIIRKPLKKIISLNIRN